MYCSLENSVGLDLYWIFVKVGLNLAVASNCRNSCFWPKQMHPGLLWYWSFPTFHSTDKKSKCCRSQCKQRCIWFWLVVSWSRTRNIYPRPLCYRKARLADSCLDWNKTDLLEQFRLSLKKLIKLINNRNEYFENYLSFTMFESLS